MYVSKGVPSPLFTLRFIWTNCQYTTEILYWDKTTYDHEQELWELSEAGRIVEFYVCSNGSKVWEL